MSSPSGPYGHVTVPMGPWYIAFRDQRIGPCSEETVRSLLTNGKITVHESMCWKMGWSDWQPLNQVPGLIGCPPTGPLAAPPPVPVAPKPLPINGYDVPTASSSPSDSSEPFTVSHHSPVAYVLGTVGVLTGSRFAIPVSGIYFGRESAPETIAIADGRISKRHAWLGVRQGRVVLCDCGSTNGVFLNDEPARITERALAGRDCIVFSGKAIAQFLFYFAPKLVEG